MAWNSHQSKTKPHDPAKLERERMERLEKDARERELAAKREKDPAYWGIDPGLSQHTTSANVLVSNDVAGRPTRAKRWDVFSLLRATYRKGDDGKPVSVLSGDHIICVDRFHQYLAIRHQTAGASNPGTLVDGLVAPDYPKARVEAGVRLDGIEAAMNAQETALLRAKGNRTHPHRARLLMALSEPTIVEGRRVNNWRAIVEQITGEFRDAEQTKEVVKACDGLEAALSAGADSDALKAYYANREKTMEAA